MANPNNPIRPHVLNISPPVPNPTPIAPAQFNQPVEERIAVICAQQCRSMIQAIMNPHADLSLSGDQTIEERFRDDCNDLNKIPDIVRSLLA